MKVKEGRDTSETNGTCEESAHFLLSVKTLVDGRKEKQFKQVRPERWQRESLVNQKEINQRKHLQYFEILLHVHVMRHSGPSSRTRTLEIKQYVRVITDVFVLC